MKKWLTLCIILVLLVCAVALSGCVDDKNRTQYCYDYKGLFSQAQLDDINEACRANSKKYMVTFLVATTNRTGSKADMWGEDFLAQEGLSDKDDYILIIINARDVGVDYHFDIYTYGNAARRLSDREIENAVWSIYADRILTSDSASAASGVVEMLPMLGKSYDGIALWFNIVFGLALGLAISGIVIACIKRHYSRKRKNETYPLDKYCRMNLTGHEDKFMHTYTSVVVINTNSGGGHGGGHSGGFGGGGGGGGHRGGR